MESSEKCSMTYPYATPLVTIPIPVPRMRSRLNFDFSASSLSIARRFSASKRMPLALAGTATFLRTFFTYSRTGTLPYAKSAPRSTIEEECAVRVVRRMNTMAPVRSDSSNAPRVMSYASWLSAGSNCAPLANLARLRLSCSFCEECSPGSSADTTTKPPLTPMYV